MPEGLLRRSLAALPHCNFHQAWGMTELSPIACIMPREYTRLNGGDARLSSCGQPMPTVEVRIVDAAGEEVARGTTGEVVVRGPTVMLGYWNKPELTASVLRGGWLHSGDLGYMDEEGFVYVVDRLKDMIITGGENVYSTEVESVISLYDGVAEVAVIGVPHELWGEAVHAVVVPQAGHSIDPEALIAFCRSRLAGYKCPLGLTIRSEPLPLSGTGKTLKTALRESFRRGCEKPAG
jgi:long-chain acyl-CoA synthetase